MFKVMDWLDANVFDWLIKSPLNLFIVLAGMVMIVPSLVMFVSRLV